MTDARAEERVEDTVQRLQHASEDGQVSVCQGCLRDVLAAAEQRVAGLRDLIRRIRDAKEQKGRARERHDKRATAWSALRDEIDAALLTPPPVALKGLTEAEARKIVNADVWERARVRDRERYVETGPNGLMHAPSVAADAFDAGWNAAMNVVTHEAERATEAELEVSRLKELFLSDEPHPVEDRAWYNTWSNRQGVLHKMLRRNVEGWKYWKARAEKAEAAFRTPPPVAPSGGQG